MGSIANLSIEFDLVDKISDKLDKIAKAGSLVEKSLENVNTSIEHLTKAGSDIGKVVETGNTLIRLYNSIGMEASRAAAIIDRSNGKMYKSNGWAEDVTASEKKSYIKQKISDQRLVEMGAKSPSVLNYKIKPIDFDISQEESYARVLDESTGALERNAQASEGAIESNRQLEESLPPLISSFNEYFDELEQVNFIIEGFKKAYELTDSFSNAQGVIVKATGATGKSLEGLNDAMMSVYSRSDIGSLDLVASAISEVNSRFGVTGEELENVTDLFVLFADNTDTSDIVTSVQSISKIMKLWNLDVSDAESVMDKLMITAQSSGISVDSLSSNLIENNAIFQELGYSMDQSIGILGMLGLGAIEAETVLSGLNTAAETLASETDKAGALSGIIDSIKNMSSESEAGMLAIKTFGESAGPDLANAIRNGNLEISQWTSLVENSQGTLQNTSAAADTLGDHWTRATNSVKTAFTTALAPGFNMASMLLAKLVGGIGNFLNENKALVVGISAAAVGLGTFVTVMAISVGVMKVYNAAKAIYTAITSASTIATAASTAATALFGVTLSAAIWPITLIVAGIAALIAIITVVTGAILGFNSSMSESEKEYQSLTAASQANHDAMTEATQNYNEAKESMSATQDELGALKAEMDLAKSTYENSKKSMEQFTEEVDSLIKSVDNLKSSYQESMNEIGVESSKTTILIEELSQLSQMTSKTAVEHNKMSRIVDVLNKGLPGLALSYDQTTGALNMSTEAIKAFADAAAASQYEQASYDAHIEAKAKELDLAYKLTEAQENLEAAKDKQDLAQANGGKWSKAYKEAAKEVEILQTQFDELSVKQIENADLVLATGNQYQKTLEDRISAEEALAKRTLAEEDAVRAALDETQVKLEQLTAAYQENYQSALSSIQNTFGLFEPAELPKKPDTQEEIDANSQKASDMMAALDSQVAWIDQYKANIEELKGLGLDDGLVNALSDGSKESMEYLNVIMAEYERLMAMGDAAGAEAIIADYSAKFQAVGESEEGFAQSIANIRTNFDQEMDKIQEKMDTTIKGLEMSEEAKANAKSTMDSYLEAVKKGVIDVNFELSKIKISGGVVSVENADGKTTTGTVQRNANGTLNSENIFIAGEEGPELIIGRPGSTVFPVSETNRILGAMDTPLRVEVPESMNAGARNHSRQEKKITLEIAGSGEINVNGSANKQSILDVMINNIKPVLMNVLQQEIFEEGDASYEF